MSSAQMDHASNPRGRRKAREGERKMHAERQQADQAGTTAAPVQREQIRARLDEIAPFPAADDLDPALALARHFAVDAQRDWLKFQHADFPANISAMHRLRPGFAAVHLLAALAAVPHVAAVAAREVADALAGDGLTGELLAGHLTALGIDAGEVGRLEEAWQALPEKPCEGSGTEAAGSGAGVSRDAQEAAQGREEIVAEVARAIAVCWREFEDRVPVGTPSERSLAEAAVAAAAPLIRAAERERIRRLAESTGAVCTGDEGAQCFFADLLHGEEA